MTRQLIDTAAKPLLDIASYARRGPARRDHFSRAELEIFARTANRTPEVMVKVLTHGGQSLRAVGRHINYIDRGGELPIETDDDRQLTGKGVEDFLTKDWDLDLEDDRRTANLRAYGMGRAPK